MAVTYTAVANVDGEGRNGGRVHSTDGLLETSLSLPKELAHAAHRTCPYSKAIRNNIPVTINATAA